MLPSGLNVTENEPIMNLNPQFFEKLGNVLKSTSTRTIANYIAWRAIYKSNQMQMPKKGKVWKYFYLNRFKPGLIYRPSKPMY